MSKTTSIVLVAVIVVFGAFYFLLGDNNSAENTPTSADNAPPGSIHNLPVPEAVTRVKEKVASETGVAIGEIVVLSVTENQWPDACLGLVGTGEICAQVITPGYRVDLKAGLSYYVYRTNSTGSVIKLEGVATE